jgi:hypothetical protein
MPALIDEIESAMRKVNPFGLINAQYSDYYYEANNMIQLLPTFRGERIDLCMDAFQLYDNGQQIWKELESEISQVLDKRKSIRRTNIIRSELLANAMSPERIVSMMERYGPSAPAETFSS